MYVTVRKVELRYVEALSILPFSLFSVFLSTERKELFVGASLIYFAAEQLNKRMVI